MAKLLSAYSETKDEILEKIKKIDISLKNIYDAGESNPAQKRENSQQILNILHILVDMNCTLETFIVENGFENPQCISSAPENALVVAYPNEDPSNTETESVQSDNSNAISQNPEESSSSFVDRSSEMTVISNRSINDSDNQENVNNTVIVHDDNQTENNTEIPEKDSHNVFDTVEQNMQLISNSATANRKLLDSNFRNRIKEAQRLFQESSIPEPFDFRLVDKSNEFFQQRILSPRKIVPKPTYELSDDTLKACMSCWVSSIKSPSEFYVRTNQELYNTLQLELNDEINRKSILVEFPYDSKDNAKMIVGDYCAAYIPIKSAYHRVHVYDWCLNDSTKLVNIYLVDTGEKSFCNYKNLTILDRKFKEVPKLAIRCHFKALYPVHGDTWSDKVRLCFSDLTHVKNQPKELYTIHVEKSGESYGVDLCEKDSNNPSIATILIEKQLAIEKLPYTEEEEEHEEEIEKGDNDEDYDDDDDDDDDFALVEYDNVNQAVTGYDARDEARICQFTNSNGTCFKGASCKLEHTKPSKDWTTTDKTLTATTTFLVHELPSAGDTILMTFTNFINCCRFYVHIINRKDDSFPYDIKLVNLVKELNLKENVITYKTFEILPAVGEIVLFKDKRGLWSRGQYLGATEKDSIGELFSVDFGTKFICTIRDIRKIEDKFLHLPFQAALCTLHNYREKPDVDQNTLQEYVRSHFYFKVFYADVITPEQPMSLQIFDGDADIGQQLKDLGFVENCEVLKPGPDSVLQLE